MKKGYDKAKAHDYYMKHRKLKGKRRKAKPKVTGGQVKNRKNKSKGIIKMPQNTALATKNSGGKAVNGQDKNLQLLQAKLADIKEKAKNLPPEKKTALKSALVAIRGKIKKR